MYFHALYYTFLKLIRNRAQFFWCLAFPILLATMFYFAFGGLGESEQFSAIPVAIVDDGGQESELISDMLNQLSEPGDDQFLIPTYTTEKKALSLLEQKEVTGILYLGSPMSLSISAEMNNEMLNQSILNTFVEQFNLQYDAISTIAQTHPEKLNDAIDALSEESCYLNDTSPSNGNFSESLTYFFNLLAMTCLYAAMIGNDIAVDNQANLSHLGARKNISPVPKLITVFGDLSAAVLFEFICVIVSICYMGFALHVDFGNQIAYILLASFVGSLTGVSLGFFIGSFGRGTKEVKFGILMAFVMSCCVLSGLMIGSMRMIVERFCPPLNHINPAALISDSFYSLVIYPSHGRYFENIGILLLLFLFFTLGGFVQIRRKKYASL